MIINVYQPMRSSHSGTIQEHNTDALAFPIKQENNDGEAVTSAPVSSTNDSVWWKDCYNHTVTVLQENAGLENYLSSILMLLSATYM